MHGAWTRGLYFDFWSKIWRHHRVLRPRFPLWRVNFCNSRTFKAHVLLLNIGMGFQDLLAWNAGIFWGRGQNRGKGWCDIDPKRTRSYFSGFLRAILVKNRSRNATVRVLADGQTHRQTDAPKKTKKKEQGIQLPVSHTLIDHHICHGVRPLGRHVKNGSFSSSSMNWMSMDSITKVFYHLNKILLATKHIVDNNFVFQ